MLSIRHPIPRAFAALALAAASACAFAATAPLLAAWQFDEGRGQLTREAVSGRMEPVAGVLNKARFQDASGPQWRAACVVRGCLLFDGYSTDVATPALTDAQVRRGVTLGAWVAPHAFEWGDGGFPSAFASQFDHAARQGIVLGAYRHGSWGAQLGFGSAVLDLRAAAHPLPRDRWSHVAVSYDADTGMARLFLNGRRVGQQMATRGARLRMPALPMTIGRYSKPVTTAEVFQVNTYRGLMDQVRVAAGALAERALAQQVAADLRRHGGRVPALSFADVGIDAALLRNDRHRPQYHAIPNFGWMNEPHAPFHYQGSYHLFFQKNPFGPFWHQIHWGHWTSPDMVHWRELPMALAPEAGSLAPDGIWSGSASMDADGAPVLFFTAGNDSAKPNQRTGLARPKDSADPDLVEWTALPAPVTLQGAGQGQPGEFRDPFVFKDGSRQRWLQLVASKLPGGSGTALVYESADLLHWTYKGPLFSIDPASHPGFDATWELPVLLPLGRGRDGDMRHVFLMDLKAQAYYWIGKFDAASGRFTPDRQAPRVFDLGQGHFSGPSGMVDPKTGRSIVFSIAQGEQSRRVEWDSGWAHNAGLPIALSLGADDELRLAPIAELASLRQRTLIDLADTTLANANAALAKVAGDMLEIELELAPARGQAARRGVAVRTTPDGQETTALYHDAGAGRFEVDRTRSSLDTALQAGGVQGGIADIGAENMRMRVFVDRSMVEAYLNERTSLTTRAFPSRPDAFGLAVLGAPGDRVVALRVWQMAAIEPNHIDRR